MAEKSLNEIGRPLREHYEKGLTAIERNNLDYAISLLTGVLQREPGFYECRQALRLAQLKKAGGGPNFFKRMIGGASASPLLAKGQIALHSNPTEASLIAEQILTGDPHSSMGHKLLVEAALAAEMPRTAILSLEILLRNDTDSFPLRRQLSRAHVMNGDITKAEEILSQLAQERPNDPNLAQDLKNMVAQKTMSQGGYEILAQGEGSFRDALKDKEESKTLEQEHRQVKTEDVADRLLREYEARLPQEPNNLKLYRSIAELHAQKKQFDLALSYYQQIQAREGTADPSLEKAISETTLRKYDHLISELNPESPDYVAQQAQLMAERNAFQIEECRQRVERYPTDLQIRFDLGVLYYQNSRVNEAISEFQKAQNNPHRRLQALYYLGLCFSAKNLHDLAARMLQNALKEKVGFDDEKKEMLYALGCVLERMNKREEAIELFKQVYEVDIAYKDVQAKVDAFYSGQ